MSETVTGTGDVRACLAARGIAFSEANGLLTPDLPRLRAQFLARQLALPLPPQAPLTLPVEMDTTPLTLALGPDLLCLDIDGCLIDTHTSFDKVVRAVIAHFTEFTVDDAEIKAIRLEGGFNDDNVLAYEIMRRKGADVALAEVFPIFRERYIGTPEQPGLYTRERPIISAELLARLRADYHVALVTGRNHEEAALALDLLDLPADIPMWTVDDVTKGKPDPEGILAAAKRFNAQRVWMVGDNLDDILAAKNAGAVAIGVGRYGDALLEAGAAIALPDINSLGELL